MNDDDGDDDDVLSDSCTILSVATALSLPSLVIVINRNDTLITVH